MSGEWRVMSNADVSPGRKAGVCGAVDHRRRYLLTHRDLRDRRIDASCKKPPACRPGLVAE